MQAAKYSTKGWVAGDAAQPDYFMNKGSVHLMLTEYGLTVVPSNAEVERFLTVEVKCLEQDPEKPWIIKNKKKRKRVFRVIREEGPRVIQTMQGFWLGLKTHLESKGYEVKLDDLRKEFPKPRFELMSGFRFSQEQLLRDFLSKNMSGLLGAPTRYGKTCLIKNTLKAYTGLTTVVTAPGADLVTQLYEDIKNELPHREVKLIGAGSRVKYPSEDITVMSMDSMDKADFGRTELLLIDEPHAAVTDSRLPVLNSFQKARRLGFGATLQGRFDGKDALITGLIGPVLAERTYLEAVAEGAICPLKVYLLRIPVNKRAVNTSWNRTQAYKKVLFESPRMAEIADRLCKQLIPSSWQTLLFIKNEKQADLYLKHIGDEGTIAMAKKLTAKQREEVMERMRGDEIKRCIASDIYAQGVTFNHVRVMINLAGGGNNTTTIQKPGRLAEVREGKKAGVIIDFMFYPGDGLSMLNCGDGLRMLFVDSNNRRKAYEEKGYEVVEVSNFEELESLTKDILV